MEFQTLNNGIKIPVLGFGVWQIFDQKECQKAVEDALSVGYRLIDTTQMYKNEREVRNAIKRCHVPREELFITTKICRPHNSYKAKKSAIENSLKELQLDYMGKLEPLEFLILM